MSDDYGYDDDFEHDAPAASSAPAAVTSRSTFQEKLRRGEIRHGGVQVVEGRNAAATQTATVSVATQAVQAPDDLAAATTRAMIDPSPAAFTKADAAAAQSAARTAIAQLNSRAVGFLRAATAVMERVCEENVVGRTAAPAFGSAMRAVVAGTGAVTILGLPAEPLLQAPGRRVLATAPSPVRPTEAAVALTAAAAAPSGAGTVDVEVDALYRAACLIAIVDTGEATAGRAGATSSGSGGTLRNVLVCHGEPTALAYTSDGSFLVAGTAVGVLHAWDLVEPAWLHQTVYGRKRVTGGARLPPGSRAGSAGATPAASAPGSGVVTPAMTPSLATPAGGADGGFSPATDEAFAPLAVTSGLRWPSYSTHAPGGAAAASSTSGGSAFSAATGAASGSGGAVRRLMTGPDARAGRLASELHAVLYDSGEDGGVDSDAASAAAASLDTSRFSSGAASHHDDDNADGAGHDSGGYDDDFEDSGDARVASTSRGTRAGTARRGRSTAGGRRRMAVPVFGAGLGALLRTDTDSGSGSGLDGDVGVAGSSSSGPGGGGAAGGGAGAQQLIAVDDAGNLHVWAIVRMGGGRGAGVGGGSDAGADGLAAGAGFGQGASGSSGGALPLAVSTLVDTADLGRSVTSQVKLVSVASIAASSATAGSGGGAAAALPVDAWVLDADASPADPALVLYGCSDGYVRTVHRLGEVPTPATFLPATPVDIATKGAAIGAGDLPLLPVLPRSPITSVAFHPHLHRYFLAGAADGTVSLYCRDHALPLHSWQCPWAGVRGAPAAGSQQPQQQAAVSRVVRVAWLQSRCTVFVAVDERGWVAWWDLAANAARPVHAQHVRSSWGAAAAASGASDGGIGAAGDGDECVVSADVTGGTDLSPTTAMVTLTFGNGRRASLRLDPSFMAPRAHEVAAAAKLFQTLAF